MASSRDILKHIVSTYCLPNHKRQTSLYSRTVADILSSDVLEEIIIALYFQRHTLPIEQLRVFTQDLLSCSSQVRPCPRGAWLTEWSNEYLMLLSEYVENVSEPKPSEGQSLKISYSLSSRVDEVESSPLNYEIDLSEAKNKNIIRLQGGQARGSVIEKRLANFLLELRNRLPEDSFIGVGARMPLLFDLSFKAYKQNDSSISDHSDHYFSRVPTRSSGSTDYIATFDDCDPQSTKCERISSYLKNVRKRSRTKLQQTTRRVNGFSNRSQTNVKAENETEPIVPTSTREGKSSLDFKRVHLENSVTGREIKHTQDHVSQTDQGMKGNVPLSSTNECRQRAEILNEAVTLAKMLNKLQLSGIDSNFLLQEGTTKATDLDSTSQIQDQSLLIAICKIKQLKNSENKLFEEICRSLGSESEYLNCSDEAFLLLCKATVTKTLTATKCRTFLSQVVKPRIQSLKKTASRVTFAALLHISDRHPNPMVEVLLVPIIASSSNSFIASKVHADLLRRLVQIHYNRPGYNKILDQILNSFGTHTSYRDPFTQDESTSASGKHSIKQRKECVEARAGVIQELLTKPLRFSLATESATRLLSWLGNSLQEFPKSLKLANVILRFLQHHKDQAVKHKQDVCLLSEKIKSFMRKNIVAKLQSL